MRDAVEVVENLSEGRLRDADALVGDGDDEMLSVGDCVHQNLGAAGGVFDAIFNQVCKRVGQMGAVAENLVLVGVQRDAQSAVRGVDQQGEAVR